MPDFKDKLSSLPMCSGVYIMKDADGNVIYVGKSKVLKNRVSQYFQNSKAHNAKTRSMVSRVADFEYLLTDTESEALALECNLIKKYKPKYNILLKDDKQYPYIKVTVNEEFPRLSVTRQVKKDGALYFGPYMSASDIRGTADLLKRLFKIRKCDRKIGDGRQYSRPCLYFHLGQCDAPCCGKIGREEYAEAIENVCEVLNGKYQSVSERLKTKMLEASENLQFERAAVLRDALASVKELADRQKITSTADENRDVIGIYSDGREFCVQVFYYRAGKAVGSEYFTFKNEEEASKEILGSFVKQLYFTSSRVPSEILLSEEIEDMGEISDWLTDMAGHKVTISVPKRGAKLETVGMVVKNARESLHKDNFIRTGKERYQNGILSDLTRLLGLAKPPFRIESYDISNISGASSVGAEIVYVNAVPQKKLYRKYNIKSVTGSNDYESMREVIYRRISEAYCEEDAISAGTLAKEDAKFLPLPDLILLDGGRGHVSAVKMLFETLGEEIPVFGLVKDSNHRTRGVTDEHSEYAIDQKSELFKFLTCMQDEVHRYAITTHRSKREKEALKSVLDGIEGVGEVTRRRLLTHFAGLERIKSAEVCELLEVTNERTARNIYSFFHNGSNKDENQEPEKQD